MFIILHPFLLKFAAFSKKQTVTEFKVVKQNWLKLFLKLNVSIKLKKKKKKSHNSIEKREGVENSI